MTNDKREALIEEAAKAIYSNERENIEGAHDWPEWDNFRPVSRESVLEAARAALAVFEQAHTPCEAASDDERPTSDPAEFYEVMGGQGLRRIAKNLTRKEAEQVRDKFDRDCDRAGLINPPSRINKQHGRY